MCYLLWVEGGKLLLFLIQEVIIPETFFRVTAKGSERREGVGWGVGGGGSRDGGVVTSRNNVPHFLFMAAFCVLCK